MMCLFTSGTEVSGSNYNASASNTPPDTRGSAKSLDQISKNRLTMPGITKVRCFLILINKSLTVDRDPEVFVELYEGNISSNQEKTCHERTYSEGHQNMTNK